MRPAVLLALALCTCKTAPPPEPKPAKPVAPVAKIEPPPAQPTAEPAAPPAEPEQCKCPADPVAAADPPDDPDDEFADEDDAKKRRARAKKKIAKPLAAKLTAAFPDHRPACDVALSGPCNLRGDLDGDGAPDDVVLVRSKDGAAGLAILYAAGPTELLGGGRRGACWTTTELEDLDGSNDVAPCPEEIDPNLAWISSWDLRPRQKDAAVLTDPGRKRTYKAPGALGDGLQLGGSDAAAVLYRTATEWTLMGLGY